MPSITVAITAHNHRVDDILHNAENQTRPPDKIMILYSGMDRPNTHHITIERPNFDDWGHDKRRSAIDLCSTDFLTFWNADDYYDKDFLKEMISVKHDLIHCNYFSHLMSNNVKHSIPKLGHITSGNFLIRADLAKQVGYNHDDYPADGKFIEDVMQTNPRVKHINKVLYTHR